MKQVKRTKIGIKNIYGLLIIGCVLLKIISDLLNFLVRVCVKCIETCCEQIQTNIVYIAVGIILILIWVVYYIRRVLAKDHIIDRWDAFIPGAIGMSDELLYSTEQRIFETMAPGICVKRQKVYSGLLQGILGRQKLFLIISNKTNYRLKLYRMYMNAEDYGTRLHVSWYLAHHPGFWKRLGNLAIHIPLLNAILAPARLFGRYAMSKESAVLGLDLFDEQDLKAYTTNIRHCLQDAVDDLNRKDELDKPEPESMSKGFMGIS